MASTSIFSPKFTPPSKQLSILSSTSTKSLISFFSHLPSTPNPNVNNCKRDFPISKVASVPYQPINQEYLEEEFSGHGVTFEGIGEICVAKMELENGSTASLMLPNGLITSYKAHMWHKGTLELLHTSVSEAEDEDEALIEGGTSLALSFASEEDQHSWSPTSWSLHGVSGNPNDSIKIEMISNDSEGKIRLKHIVTLKQDMLSSELMVSNLKSSPLQMLGGFMSHITVSTPDAIYALGLDRSNFFDRQPIDTEYTIIPPRYGDRSQPGYGQVYGKMTLQALGSTLRSLNKNYADVGRRNSYQSEEDGEEGEEDDSYKQLTEEMSRIYTSAPRVFTFLDRGKRNSITVGRSGFEELYLMSPGSVHEFYSKYAYILVGKTALLKPIMVAPGDEWIGSFFIHNPNSE
uniref:NDH-dependent cyclic electron flow 5 n=1 Tax=Monsonia emarginata TaxID=28966 RepID=A0A0F7H063_9ROSI